MAVLSACILPVCALSLVSNAYEQEAIRQAIDATQESNVAYYLEMLEQELSRLRNITYSYMNDQEFQELSVVYSNVSQESAELLAKITTRSAKCAQIVVAMIPIICVYPFLQRYFVKGIVLGSVKG